MELNKDAFSSGQIGSKIWLCEELEKIFESVDHIHIYGGWYGLTAFLLLSRGKIKIKSIRSYDVDPACESIADMINENWVIDNWTFKAFTKNCDHINDSNVDLIINTSTEHFDSLEWFNNIPKGTWVVLQGNNMDHEDHRSNANNLEEFVEKFDLSKVYYSGEKDFVYPDWQFTRYMVIGIR